MLIRKFKGLDNIDKVIAIDQSPIGRNPRSNPATYIKLFDEIRDLFAQLPESQAVATSPGALASMSKKDPVLNAKAWDMIKIDMDFMEDAWIDCPLCKTKRFDHETLSVLYKGKNIYDILEMEVGEAVEFFPKYPFHQAQA